MKFTKMQGAGNDYVYVNCFEEKVEDPAATAIRVSDRHFGIGSDGLILICPSDHADCRMRMFNADGSEGEMCGNAIRCVGKYVYDHGVCSKTELVVETLGGDKYLTLNVKDGIIQEALVETIGCSGMTHSAAMASEILPGKTILEALNTDLVCDAINTAMRELFLQIVYGRTQSAFSDDGLAVGAGLEDLGKGLRSQVGTMYATKEKGVRYLEMAEGYVTGIALDEDNEVIGYQFVSLGKMTDFIKKGDDPNTAWEKAKGQYGRVADAVKIIDPRKE